MTNKIVYDGGKSKYQEYKRHQNRMKEEFDALLINPGAIVLFEDEYYVYTWDLQDHRMCFEKMSQKEIKQAIKDGRIS